MTQTIELESWSPQTMALPADVALSLAGTNLLDVQLADDSTSCWRLIPNSRIGVAIGPGWELRIRPRLTIPRLMFLLGYATDPNGWRELGPSFEADEDLLGALAHGFAAQAERVLARGPIRGYVRVNDECLTLRGHLRVGDQIARHPGLPIPLEVAYDDYLLDVPENRMVRGATELLLRLPRVHGLIRRRLLRIRETLVDATPTLPSPAIEAPPVTRLNAHYSGVLAIATLILRSRSIATNRGSIVATAFTFDMNEIFEAFLSASLREALQAYGGRVRLQDSSAALDVAARIGLKPDITWWRDGACRAVLDAKYKRLTGTSAPNADIYQMLAYCTALKLRRGYLVYAKDGERASRIHAIRNTGTEVVVHAIDVEQLPDEVLREVNALARAIAGEKAWETA